MTEPSAQAAPLTRVLWARIEPLFDKILSHPFITGLTDGGLQPASFRFYIIQDALYLRDFARALSLAAAKAPTDEAMMMFNEHAAGVVKVEQLLHEGFFKDWGLTEADVRETPMAPTNLAYTRYMIAVAYDRPFHEILAMLLPCYWIYWEVGKALQENGSREALYQRWIDTYGGEAFGESVQSVLALADRIAAHLGALEREAMARHFITTSRYEWMFWEMGYRQEQWPVSPI
uniref:Aminopyrimidine aminohydrolase n=1 Tax=Candidatus Kentrum eta TaxID=2126337 RepID=A0A450UZQ0_9GAMM|nr:MAG: thiaminase /4-amino-5-aminomethyl-2-methylpyrimidine deaminase [Candidatus Kentron sp. H]VFJ91392.1 MAG: thiaminase /4-amino-5-aminomethyl-2-methylpyrimidine deaminase [Candidatus Kentron sp. H]VFJ98054.1 MAG: thiaminase /4-amino-5-aminomethyl-2-methylpyrimidine deaminase [Candidatus Kentron sp. H]